MGISGDNRSEVVSRRGLVLYAVKYTIFLYKLTGTDLCYWTEFDIYDGFWVRRFAIRVFEVFCSHYPGSVDHREDWQQYLGHT